MTTGLRMPPKQVAPPSAPLWLRIARAAALGGVPGAAVAIAGHAGVLHGPWVLALVVVAVLAVPTSRQLSRRILLSVCLGFGWLPVLWWVHLPDGDLGRGGLVLALMLAGLGFWVGWGHDPRPRARLLLPRLHVVDCLPFLAAGVGAVVLSPWLQAKSATQSVGLLLRGPDHVGHFGMVHMIRQNGVTLDLAAPPSPSGDWRFASYPQAFHAVAATVTDLLIGPQDRGLAAELNAYSQTVAIITVCSVAMLVAGLCALPALRSRPVLALPVAAFTTAVLVLGPGANLIEEGFPNFSFACVLVCALALVAVPMARVVSPLHLAAMGGAIVGVANGWIMLLALAGPAALIVLFPHRRRRWTANRRQYTIAALITLATAACVVRAGLVVSGVSLSISSALAQPASISPPNLAIAITAVAATYMLCALLSRTPPTSPRHGLSARAAALRALPVAGLAVAAGLVGMHAASGGGTYYFVKFVVGLDVICLVLLTVPLALLAARWTTNSPPARVASSSARRLALSLAVTIAATQLFGWVLPAATPGVRPTAVGLQNRSAQNARLAAPAPAAQVVDAAVQLNPTLHGRTVIYFRSLSDNEGNPQLAGAWYMALTGRVVTEDYDLLGMMDTRRPTVEQVAASASRILIARPDAYVAVQADQVPRIRALLTGPALADHVVGWS